MKIKNLVLAGLFLMSSLTIASAQVKLSFNPEKGKKYEYQVDITQKIQQNLMGQSIPLESEISTTYLVEVKDKSPQETTVQFTYKDVVCIISSPMMKMGYDSKDPIGNGSELDKMLAKMYSHLIDVPIMVVIAPDGSVKSVTGMDGVAENMMKSIANDGQMATQIGASMKSQFTDDAIKNSFGQFFNMYPANAIKTGESWNMESDVSVNNMNLNHKTKYTLKEVKKNVATIAVASDLKMNLGAGAEGEIAGTGTGTVTVDVKTGLSVISEITQNMKGTVKAQGMEVQMELITKTKTTTKEVK